MIGIKRIADHFSYRNRLRKYGFFYKYFNPTCNDKVLDVGAAEEEYRESENIFEKKYPYLESVTVLGIDSYKEFCKRYPQVKTITYQGDTFPFNDKEFDICWCNAVLEHVGDINKQEKFIREIRRVSKNAFVTTPNRCFPFEVHTRILLLHLLPKEIFDTLLTVFGKSWATGDYMHLLSLSKIKYLFEKCEIINYKIIKNKIFGFTLEFIMIF
jgi:SAM-dependent methyltransferase